MLYLARKLTDNQETLKLFTIHLFNPTYYYSIRSSDVFNSLKWSHLEERGKTHLIIMIFKAFNNNCPAYLLERFHRTSEVHNNYLRGSNYDLQLPRLPKTNFLKRSFSYRGAMAWNQIKHVGQKILLSLNLRYPKM